MKLAHSSPNSEFSELKMCLINMKVNKQISFSCERFCSRTCFETKVNGLYRNSQIVDLIMTQMREFCYSFQCSFQFVLRFSPQVWEVASPFMTNYLNSEASQQMPSNVSSPTASVLSASPPLAKKIKLTQE